jgi:superfamily I DNA/RNA helicase
MKTLFEKFVYIQTSLSAPKQQMNKFGGYKYRSCEDILEALKPLLKETGLFLLISDEIKQIGERYYLMASATITDGDQKMSCSAYAREAENKKGMDEAQVTGSASSYARKYALNGLFCIDDTKDPDSTNTHSTSTEKTKTAVKEKADSPAFDTNEMIILAKELFKDQKTFAQWLHAKFQEVSVKDLSPEKYKMALTLLYDMKASQ